MPDPAGPPPPQRGPGAGEPGPPGSQVDGKGAAGALTVIGTGHVFQVRDTVRGAIEALRPDIVFVELDRGRLHALQERARGAPPPEGGSFVHRRLQRFQEEVAGTYGADVGEEMLAAVEGARRVGARVALIDPPADATVGKVLKQLTWRERLRAFGLLARAGLARLTRRSASVEHEVARYQEDPDAALEEVRRTFPTVHRIVIAERDAVMARRIAHLMRGARHGVAVVGDGHVPGLLRLLDDLRPTVYRLADVREGRLPRPAGSLAVGTPASVSFGFDAAAHVPGDDEPDTSAP